MISVKNLFYTYGSENTNNIKAVDDINFSLNDGEVLGIIGKTGSGKSTLVRMLNGLLRPTKGEVILDGKNVHQDFKNSREVFFKVGLVFQYPEHQLFESSVFEDIAFGLRNKGTPEHEINKMVEESAELLGIDKNLLSCSTLSLSGGEKRKCAIAGVLAMKPDVLILDEPTAGLDYLSKKNLIEYLRKYHQKGSKTIIFISHVLEEVIELSTKILVMDSGKSVYYGTSKDLFEDNKKLSNIGLHNNQINQIMSLIKEHGYNIDGPVLTVSQAKNEIIKFLK